MSYTNFVFDIIEYNEKFELEVKEKKNIYNVDSEKAASAWVREEVKGRKTFDAPQISSAINIKTKGYGNLTKNAFGYLYSNMNNISENTMGITLVSGASSRGHGVSIIPENIHKVTTLFTARKSIIPTWVNCKDEYLAPDESHPQWQQFVNDSLVYSLFNNSSQQSSLRQVEYKGKLWDIKNEFFWLGRDEMISLAEEHNFDELYRDAKSGAERFVYSTFQKFGTFGKLSDDASQVLDFASDLLRRSFSVRQLFSDAHPEYHLSSFDAGYAQLKLLWKEYYKDEFLEFRSLYKAFEDRLRPLVYELGFLR